MKAKEGRAEGYEVMFLMSACSAEVYLLQSALILQIKIQVNVTLIAIQRKAITGLLWILDCGKLTVNKPKRLEQCILRALHRSLSSLVNLC